MSEITPIIRAGLTTPKPSTRPPAQDAPAAGTARGSDRVEFSQAAQLLSKLSKLPEVRQDVVDRVKAEIAAGNYDTEEKIDAAIDKMAEDLQ